MHKEVLILFTCMVTNLVFYFFLFELWFVHFFLRLKFQLFLEKVATKGFLSFCNSDLKCICDLTCSDSFARTSVKASNTTLIYIHHSHFYPVEAVKTFCRLLFDFSKIFILLLTSYVLHVNVCTFLKKLWDSDMLYRNEFGSSLLLG